MDGRVFLYEVRPRIGVRAPLSWGSRFTLCYLKVGGRLRVYAYTTLSREALLKYVDVTPVDPGTILEFLGKPDYVSYARLTRVMDFYRDVASDDLIGELLNPILKYLPGVPRPLDQQVLYLAWMAGLNSVGLADLAIQLGVRKELMEEAVARLSPQGYIKVEKVAGKRVVYYRMGLFKGLKSIARSSEGRALARIALKAYIGRGWYASIARQDPELKAKPDIVAIIVATPVDKSTWRPMYSRAVAVEVESCTEIETHPDQVVRNLTKPSVKDFTEVHVWVSNECKGRLEELIAKANIETNVKIVAVKLKPRKQPQTRQPPAQAGTRERRKVEVEVGGVKLLVDETCWRLIESKQLNPVYDGRILWGTAKLGDKLIGCKAQQAEFKQTMPPDLGVKAPS